MDENLICPNCTDFTAHWELNQVGPLFTGSNGPYVEVYEDVWVCDNCGHTLKIGESK
jgi:C4-type Zn-finger protein